MNDGWLHRSEVRKSRRNDGIAMPQDSATVRFILGNMSKSKDKEVVSIEGGRFCPHCRTRMQRFEHSVQWKPLPGRNYYKYWDRCFRCKQIKNYEEAKVYSKEARPPVQQYENAGPTAKARRAFYQSQAWKRLRYETLVKYGARCLCCGADSKKAVIRVDHIKPISKYWDLRLDPANVQPLCNDCNWGKLDRDETDWR